MILHDPASIAIDDTPSTDSDAITAFPIGRSLKSPPVTVMDGWFGSSNRVDQFLSHDVVTVVTGGAGVAPFLSVLDKLFELGREDFFDLRRRGGPVSSPPALKLVDFHWICRDVALVDHVSNSYFSPLISKATRLSDTSSKIESGGVDGGRLVLTRRAGNREFEAEESFFNLRVTVHITSESETSTSDTKVTMHRVNGQGTPMDPSHFSTGTKESVSSNLSAVASFVSIFVAGISTMLYIEKNVQTFAISSKMWSPIALGIVVVFVSHITVACTNLKMRLTLFDRFCGGKWRAIETCESTSDTSSETDEAEIDEAVFEIGSVGDIPRDEEPNSSTLLNNQNTVVSGVPVIKKVLPSSSPKKIVLAYQYGGRPSTDVLLSGFEGASRPGVFMCGPMSMVDSIHKATRPGRCGSDLSRPAVYVETFEN